MLKLSFQHQILGGFFAFLLCGFSLAIISYNSVNTLQENSMLIDQTEKVISTTGEVMQLLTDAESGVRGYVLTGDESFLDSYTASAGIISPIVQELRRLVSENNTQQNLVDTLNFYTTKKQTAMLSSVEARRSGGFAAGQETILKGPGKYHMDKVRKTVSEIHAIEETTLKERKKNSVNTVINTSVTIFIGSIIEIAILLLLLKFIRSTFAEQALTEQRVSLANLKLTEISKENKNKNWLLIGSNTLGEAVRKEHDSENFTVDTLATKLLVELATYLNAQVGAIYIADDHGKKLQYTGGYAYKFQKGEIDSFNLGEGLIGEAALSHKAIIVNNIPTDHIKMNSGLGDSTPKALLIQPVYAQGKLQGVLELGFTDEVSPLVLEFIEWMKDIIGVEISTAQAKVRTQELFEQIDQQAEELEVQQEELRTTNEDLTRKTEMLQSSEEELRVQQEELIQMNSELEEKADMLEERNKAVEQARVAISIKAEELEQTNKYKSEFLANMSHELRTPLNSILILARILKENKKANLNEEQVKYASVIQNAGNDLLTLINDILDLAKIESGKIDLTIEDVELSEIKRDIELLFCEVANNKKIEYEVNISDDVPEKLASDRMRIEQVLKNLLSNSFKFTPEKGTVKLDVSVAPADKEYTSNNLADTYGKTILAFAIKDTGIGIPLDKQKSIFEAFQQADGSTSRKYGGTGLGLSISRELSNILGGEIQIASTPGEGSVFTLYVPVVYHQEYESIKQEEAPAPAPWPEAAPTPQPVRNNVTSSNSSKPVVPPTSAPAKSSESGDEQVMLIVEDDANFAEILKNYAIERGFRPLIASRGDVGLEMAIEHVPDSIILDIMLPVMDGWTILKKLKENPKTQNIPVHMMSANDEKLTKAKNEGAIGFLKKPVEKSKLDEAFDKLTNPDNKGGYKLTKVLIIEDHEIQSENLRNQLVENHVKVLQAFDGQGALKILGSETGFDCIILDINLPDISGLDLLDKIKADENCIEIPVIINTAMDLSKENMERVLKHTHAMVLKSSRSNDRLLDEVNLFMHKVKHKDKGPTAEQLFPKKVKPIITLEKALVNKSVLIVDDDMRNIFALSSVLQGYEMNIEIAINGIDALKKLDQNPGTHIVLMDIMMPEMDGYEAMTEIRKQDRFAKLPMIALTAKAMKNDREKCIEAGANDYISKPVDIDKLVSMMRVWLS